MPEVAEVVSISGVPELTTTDSVEEPNSNCTSISFLSAVWSWMPRWSATLNPDSVTENR